MWRALTAGLIVALVAVAPARADTYSVVGTDDTATPPPCEEIFPTAWQCPTLRSAINAANLNDIPDSIVVPSGVIQLNAGTLTISDDTTIIGGGPDVTTVGGLDLSDRVFTISSASAVAITGLTVAGGFSSSLGGNILVGAGSSLTLTIARVTGGNAISGGGIANLGTLILQSVLVDGNTAQASGGGVANRAEDGTVETTIFNSTLAKNTAAAGAGLFSIGTATTRLTHVTIGRNIGEGVQLFGPQTASADATIVASNTLASCAGVQFGSAAASVTDGTTCGFALQGVDPGLSADLVLFAGDFTTSVLTIPATSPAVDIVNPCQFPFDQRLQPRFTAALAPCDAGAFEESASGAGGTFPTPTPTPNPTASPTPTPTPTPTPPVFDRTVGVLPISGSIEVCPPREKCRPLKAGETIPMKSTVDARKGVVELTSLSSAGGAPQKARFSEGIFRVDQVGQITELTLTEKLAACSRRAGAAQSKKPKARKLWGDGKGKFRTKGRYSAATVRGTRWLVQDTCAGTLTRVTQGAVTVRDFGARKTVIVRKGKRYLARARR